MANILIFTGGGYPSKKDAEHWLSFFGKIDCVIAADSGLDAALDWGIIPDYVCGDMDSLADKKSLEKIPDEKIKIWPTDKDYSDTEIALQTAASLYGGLSSEHGAGNALSGAVHHILLVGGSGGRIDHFLAILKLYHADIFPDIWLCEEQALLFLKPGHELRLCSLPPEAPVSVFPVERDDCFAAGKREFCINSDGLKWKLDNLDWKKTPVSLSNRAEGGAASFFAKNGAFLVIVPLSAEKYEE